MKKGISIAMATYNGGKYLRQQLDSIYSQDLLPDEVVVSDDGSTDDTLSILEEYHKTHGLKYSINTGVHGCNHNFYRAISLCSMDIIAICDQDDIWLTNKVSTSYHKLCEIENNKPACVSSLCNHINGNGQFISKLKDIPDSFGYAATLLTIGRNQGCSLMFNKKLAEIVLKKIDTFPEIKDILFYDVFIAFSAAMMGYKYNLGNRLMLYRHHSTNVLAKEKVEKESLIEKIRNTDYFSFIPHLRFGYIKKMLEWYKGEEIDKKAYSLCQKIVEISNKPHYSSFKIILNINELPLIKRYKIILGTCLIDFFKLFI